EITNKRELLAIRRQSDGTLNVFQYFSRRAAQNRNLLQRTAGIVLVGRDIVDKLTIGSENQADVLYRGRRDNLGLTDSCHLAQPNTLLSSIFGNMSDILSIR